jgi:hypothetical protein
MKCYLRDTNYTTTAFDSVYVDEVFITSAAFVAPATVLLLLLLQ